jgi:hypothetical protein
MPLGQYLLGAAFFVSTVGAVGVGAGLLVSRRLRHWDRLGRVMAFALLWLAGVVFAELLPAAATVLTRGTVLATAVALLLAAALVPPSPGPARPPGRWPIDAIGAGRLSWALAAIGVGAVLLVALAYLAGAAQVAVEGNDYLTFTMPNLGRWIQSGSLWMSNQFTPLIQTSTYPNNGDAILLSALLPWHDDALVRLANLPLYALLGASVYALSRELGARRSTAALMGSLVLSIQDVSLPALQDIKPDTFMLATFGVGLWFLVRHHRTRDRADLLLAGLGLGLAFGARWYGVSTVVVALVVWAIASLLAGRQLRGVAREGGILCGVVLLAGGLWLVRNLIVTGNPIYPVRVAALGLAAPHDPFDAAYNRTVANYLLTPGSFFRDLLPLYRYGIGIPGAILAGGSLLALGLAASARRGAEREIRAAAAIVLTLLAGAVAIVAAYVVTPLSAAGTLRYPIFAPGNARYALGAAIPAAAAVAWAVRRLGRAGRVVEAAAVVGIGFGIHQQFPGLPARRFGEAVVVIVVALAAGWALRATLRRVPPDRRRVVIVASVVLAVGAGVVVGRELERRVDETRYADADPALRWLSVAAPAGHRIGIAGAWAAVSANWPAFGPRLGNDVGYVGYTFDHMLVQFAHQAPFEHALRRGGYDLVVLGRGWYPDRPFARSSPLSPTTVAQQATWLQSAGFALVASGFDFFVYERARRPDRTISSTARRLNDASLYRSAVSRPPARSSLRSSGSRASDSSAFASPAASPASNSNAFARSARYSPEPPRPVATTGRPSAIASSGTSPHGSAHATGNTTASAAR